MIEKAGTRPSVVVLGGGYGGMFVAKLLDDVADVTLVDPNEAFMHNLASLRALVEPEWLDRIFFPYRHLLVNGRFLRDSAVAVDGRHVTLASGETLEPDYLVLATGSAYPFPAKTDKPDTESTKAAVRAAHEVLAGAERVLLVGAGPVGLELAGEIKASFPGKHVTIADVAPDILTGPYAQELRDELRGQLTELGVELKLGSPLRELPSAPPATAASIAIATEAGEKLTADVWYRCFGVAPRTDYLRGTLARARDDQGRLAVDGLLRVQGQERVFAIGDISDADRDMAGFARMQGELLAANLRATITGEGETVAYERQPALILVPLGPEGGDGQLPGQTLIGREMASQIKGEHLMVDSAAALFTVPDPA
ncbi:NADH dehydrogenase, FAD-containing subunit [Nonomuraea solani]|uniref:NADH dehydrogenase, FAD-containing subunit n=1 Tax=Nonomuraea solani TaxID=1144553 RepID=A0A1H5V6G6_9ACTN|nr:FAD-dependent oxidoreductase [Nonomuraea solani]SEF82776.1 NADH dehydrogenase, FAD-containing subunit [Nonomuraea solani]